ncbi:hypothetical protein NPIL_516411 [Nephila pilipes]|uniref:Uncharacterized protein n=1 Tax=Nephila pilipes TaxID=299642 RepID=A0A8X6NQF9_NEPPI|nr:hypothetical protein NPIL_516411 [Nephila pilipes]
MARVPSVARVSLVHHPCASVLGIFMWMNKLDSVYLVLSRWLQSKYRFVHEHNGCPIQSNWHISNPTLVLLLWIGWIEEYKLVVRGSTNFSCVPSEYSSFKYRLPTGRCNDRCHTCGSRSSSHLDYKIYQSSMEGSSGYNSLATDHRSLDNCLTCLKLFPKS